MESQVDIASGLVTSVDISTQVCSQLVNWCIDASGANVPRPAIISRTATSLGASPVIGVYPFQGNILVVTADRYIYKVSSSAPTLAVPLSSSTATSQLDGTGRPVFAEDASDVFIAGGGAIQKWTPGTALAVRLGGTAPTRVSHVAVLGQRLVANNTTDQTTKDNFYWSDAGDNNDSVFNALSVANAEARPDDIVGIYENTSELFIFGETTLQVYSIGSDPLAPFDRANTLNLGCAGIYSPTRIDETRFALLDERLRIVATDGRSVEPIGDAIENTLRAMSDPTDCWGFRRTSVSYDELVMQFPTAMRTLVCDLRTRKWRDDEYYSAGTQQPMPFGGYAFWPALRTHVYGSSLSAGGLYELSATTRADLGGPLLCERTTGWGDLGSSNRKRYGRVRCVLRRGTVAVTGTPGAMEIRVQDDGGAWSGWSQASIGNEGDGNQTVDFFMGGVGRRRRYGLRYAGSDDTALVSVIQHAEVLGS